ncbi:hypothetical protein SAMN05421741_11624 [Paenimyroides ummariense]|uniref:DUF4468 domain-containing protein n=1 Tax=Paenimyroides ummariense TaxID=913024 RepID=A0A1I5DJV3_9FLAO|nr:hypothetical protein [Paenimyroides ummariense]SFN99397.1 hypothetical protein SAMN05421741_11624 [Paenimyroides ummariense]
MNIKIPKITACILLSVLPCTVFCQDKIDFSKCKPTMPNPGKFGSDVYTKKTYKGADGNFDYTYQQVMFESACVDVENMTEKEIGQKLRDWWDLYKGKLLIDSWNFNVTYGSIFKYAIYGGVTAFIDDVIYYKFDLNFVDESDGRTVLDYTRDEMKKHEENSAIRKWLKDTYEKLRKAGAKHKSEL